MWNSALSLGDTSSPRTTVSPACLGEFHQRGPRPRETGFGKCDGTLREGPVAYRSRGEPRLLGGCEFDERVDARPGDADGHGGLVVGQTIAERQAQLGRRRLVAANGSNDPGSLGT